MIRRLIAISLLVTMLSGAAAASCGVGDFDEDGFVGGADLGLLLGEWDQQGSFADLDADGRVDGADLGLLLASWGPTETAPGVFPAHWISGGPACPTEPDIQVHQYNENMYILRQSLCTNFEAPFMYLLFGTDKVLMQDTGAGGIAIADTVYAIIDDWLATHEQESIELIVTHSHGHGDHQAGDSQFIGQPDTTVVGLSQSAVANFFGIDDWPNEIVEFDLGGRIIDVIPIPGHQSAHIALYDRETGILFTGDTLYPGRLYISNFSQYVESIGRMVDFTETLPTCWVLGTHIEMTNQPGVDQPFGSTHHPDEHPLQLHRGHLLELLEAVIAMQDDPFIEPHDDFIVYPLGGSEQSACCGRPHGAADPTGRR